MSNEIIDAINELIDAINIISDRIVTNSKDIGILTDLTLDLEQGVIENADRMAEINTTITENLTFIKGMGDVADAMANVLLDVTDKQNVVNQTIANIMKNSQAFLNQATDKEVSISQRWLLEFMAEIISHTSHWSQDDAFSWLRLKFQDVEHELGTRIVNLAYNERIDVVEKELSELQKELKVSSTGMLILRTVYMVYVSYWFARPFMDYPYLENWLGNLRDVCSNEQNGNGLNK